jgi:hypothetical protein
MRPLTAVLVASFLAVPVTLSGCKGESPPPPPAAPTSLRAVPGDALATLTWTGSPGATGYTVYHSSTLPVVSTSPHVTATGTSATVSGLANGSVTYFAVTASGEGGESAFTAPACAVPTAADTSGLVLHDGLCGTVLDGHAWRNGTFSAGVSGGAAVLGVEAGNEEPRSQSGLFYGSSVSVNAPGSRVSTLRASLSVPASTAARSGGGEIRGAVQLVYQPPARRLNYPGALQDVLLFQAGLVDAGGGLYAFRTVGHCDNPACSSFSATNVAFSDPAGFAPVSTGSLLVGSRAAYDTTYTFTVSLDEATGIFHWVVAGGPFGTGIQGTADPSDYLAATPGWAGVPLAGAGFMAAGLNARTEDDTSSGGGAGKVTVRFGDAFVGLNGGTAVAWDDFGGSGTNSGPTELSPARWNPAGSESVALSNGALVLEEQATSTGAAIGQAQVVTLGGAASDTRAFQVEVAIPSHVETGGASSWVGVQGRFYNDGTAGGAPASALGDVMAGVILRPVENTVSYSVMRATTPSGNLVTVLDSGEIAGATVGTGLHAVRVAWDPVLRTFTFAVDGAAVTVDAPTAVAGPANAPFARVFTYVSAPAVAGNGGSIRARLNNVFVAP